MSSLPTHARGMYFEEFVAGQSFTSVGRTITETDIINFAGLTGDYNLIHTNAKYSQTTPFGQRVAHGLLGLAIAMGLVVRSGIMEGTVLAFREIAEWKFVKPVFIGDTIHVAMRVLETQALRGVTGGAITIEVRVLNQQDETVMKGQWKALITSRPNEDMA